MWPNSEPHRHRGRNLTINNKIQFFLQAIKKTSRSRPAAADCRAAGSGNGRNRSTSVIKIEALSPTGPDSPYVGCLRDLLPKPSPAPRCSRSRRQVRFRTRSHSPGAPILRRSPRLWGPSKGSCRLVLASSSRSSSSSSRRFRRRKPRLLRLKLLRSHAQ